MSPVQVGSWAEVPTCIWSYPLLRWRVRRIENKRFPRPYPWSRTLAPQPHTCARRSKSSNLLAVAPTYPGDSYVSLNDNRPSFGIGAITSCLMEFEGDKSAPSLESRSAGEIHKLEEDMGHPKPLESAEDSEEVKQRNGSHQG